MPSTREECLASMEEGYIWTYPLGGDDAGWCFMDKIGEIYSIRTESSGTYAIKETANLFGWAGLMNTGIRMSDLRDIFSMVRREFPDG